MDPLPDEGNSSCPPPHLTYSSSLASTSSFGMTIFMFSIVTLSFLAIVLNIVILFAIFTKHRISHLNFMVANLAVVCSFGAVMGAIYVCGLDKLFQNLWLCSLFSYLRNCNGNLISMGILGISYERVRSMSNNVEGDLLISRMIGGIWLISFGASAPSLFATVMVTNKCGVSICMKSTPIENYSVGVIYEVFRTLVFHIIVSLYLLYEMIKFRARLKYFFVNANISRNSVTLRKKVARVRFVYINSVMFILIWVPYGVGLSFYKNTTLQERYQAFAESREDWERREDSIYFYILASLFFCYLLLLPLIVFGTNDAFLSCCCGQQQEMGAQVTNEVATVALSGEAESQV